jgi:hypothetical protein
MTTEIRDPQAFADQLAAAIYDHGQRLDRWETEAHPRVKVPLRFEAKAPLHHYVNSILSGRVEKAWTYCEHVGPNPQVLILVRSSKRWILGCHPCTSTAFTEDGEDHRCDWCGDPRPDDGLSVAFHLAYLGLVGSFCRRHRAIMATD